MNLKTEKEYKNAVILQTYQKESTILGYCYLLLYS